MPRQPSVERERSSSHTHPPTTQTESPPIGSLDDLFFDSMGRMLGAVRGGQDLADLAENLRRATNIVERAIQNDDSPADVRASFRMWSEISRMVSVESELADPVLAPEPEPAGLVAVAA